LAKTIEGNATRALAIGDQARPPTTQQTTTRPMVEGKFVYDRREIRARLDSPIAQALLKMGYRQDLIRTAFETRLETVGDDFPDTSQLLEAVLEIEEQLNKSAAASQLITINRMTAANQMPAAISAAAEMRIESQSVAAAAKSSKSLGVATTKSVTLSSSVPTKNISTSFSPSSTSIPTGNITAIVTTPHSSANTCASTVSANNVSAIEPSGNTASQPSSGGAKTKKRNRKKKKNVSKNNDASNTVSSSGNATEVGGAMGEATGEIISKKTGENLWEWS